MAILIVMDWPGVTKEQYEAVRSDIDWVANPPAGGLLHVAAFADDGMHVVDLWDSPEQFQAFVDSKLGAATGQAGITSQPNVQMFPTAYIDQLGIKNLA
ncbi:MAG: hypothetical protein AB7P33_04445 [Dehalococcoidia bacterium]